MMALVLDEMEFTVRPVEVTEILPWRELYRQEMNCQIVHDSLHARRGLDAALPHRIWTEKRRDTGRSRWAGRGPERGPSSSSMCWRSSARVSSRRLRRCRSASAADAIETQTNDVMLTAMLHTWAHDVVSEKIIFEDKLTTAYRVPGAVLRKREPEGDWMLLEVGGEVAATGGILYHYNRPYGDIWMEVAEPFRGRGFGTYLVQELKRICHEGGSVPCARCNTGNVASRETLQKAGFVPCAHMLSGKL